MVKFKCGDIFLVGETIGLLYGLMKQFKETDEGGNIIDGYFVAFYGTSNDNDNTTIPKQGKYIVAI